MTLRQSWHWTENAYSTDSNHWPNYQTNASYSLKLTVKVSLSPTNMVKLLPWSAGNCRGPSESRHSEKKGVNHKKMKERKGTHLLIVEMKLVSDCHKSVHPNNKDTNRRCTRAHTHTHTHTRTHTSILIIDHRNILQIPVHRPSWMSSEYGWQQPQTRLSHGAQRFLFYLHFQGSGSIIRVPRPKFSRIQEREREREREREWKKRCHHTLCTNMTFQPFAHCDKFWKVVHCRKKNKSMT